MDARFGLKIVEEHAGQPAAVQDFVTGRDSTLPRHGDANDWGGGRDSA